MSSAGRRHASAIGAGVLATVALVATARLAIDDGAAHAPPRTVTYEVRGPVGEVEIAHGDVFDRIFSPTAATTIERAPLPWTITVPLSGAPSLHDLAARTDEAGVILECAIRVDGVLTATNTAPDEVGCDTTPAAAR